MDKGDSKHNGGFLLGLFVGALITLLFTTKKGRKILKTLSSEGLEKFGEWEGLIKDVTDAIDEDTIDGNDFVEENSGSTHTGENQWEKEYSNTIKDSERSTDNPVSKISSSTKRFFRGVRKKAKQ